MRKRKLGNTGLEVSEIALGTVELGMDYGFKGSAHYQRPSAEVAIRLVREAVDRGINLIDTAPSYGESEALIGKALHGRSSRPYLATKLSIPDQSADKSSRELRSEIEKSIEKSLTSLQVDTLDLVQIHNMTDQILGSQEVIPCLEKARQQGKIRFVGASVYAEDLAMQVLQNGAFQALQLPFNLLDQKMARSVFPVGAASQVGILVRSAFLRGVLTSQVHQLPEPLLALKKAALECLQIARDEARDLFEVAIRFCLSHQEVSSVIVGVRSREELKANVAAALRGKFSTQVLGRLRQRGIQDEWLVNPGRWKEKGLT